MKRSPLKRKTPLRPSLSALMEKGVVQRASTFKAKPKPMRRLAKGNPGWYKWAVKEVWNKREHECEVCGAFLASPLPIHFSHLLPRGLYKKYIRDERNVVLKCSLCHMAWTEFGDKANLAEWSERWKPIVERYQELKNEANNVQ